jgi:tetratricopeptide (TPR) repeat protein
MKNHNRIVIISRSSQILCEGMKRISLTPLVSLLVWVNTFFLTNTGEFISFAWSQERMSVRDGSPQQLLDPEMERAAFRLYKNALKFYDQKTYWKAARELIIILDYYPAFNQADGVLCHLGECLYEMRMYKSAAQMFRFLITKYPQSEYLAQAFYGLQRIHYQTEEHAESLIIYSGIVNRFSDASIIDGVYYYAGMSYYYQREYDNTIAVLSKVRSRSEYFDYSLYTVGLAYLKKKRSTRPSRRCVSC